MVRDLGKSDSDNHRTSAPGNDALLVEIELLAAMKIVAEGDDADDVAAIRRGLHALACKPSLDTASLFAWLSSTAKICVVSYALTD